MTIRRMIISREGGGDALEVKGTQLEGLDHSDIEL